MAKLSAPLILASASPRRAALLKTVGIPFAVKVSGVSEESIQVAPPVAYARACAELKLRTVQEQLDFDAFVLAADTVVAVDDEILGKPRDAADARAMLARLAGRAHRVVTAVCLGSSSALLDSMHVGSEVRFREISADEAQRYVDTGEGNDKAGGYAVQGIASAFVSGIDGSYTNVVGLPISETLLLLRKHGALLTWP